jgi:hypothetical protein
LGDFYGFFMEALNSERRGEWVMTMMTTSAGVNKHLRRYVCLGLKVSLAPSAHDRFPPTGARGRANDNGGGSVSWDRSWQQAVQPAIYWIMVKIPICEVVLFSHVVLRHMIEFWNCEVVEIGADEECHGLLEAPRTPAKGREATLMVIPDGESSLEQHVIKLEANGFETSNGIWVTLEPAANGRMAALKISRYVDLLAEQRVSKIGATCFDLRDASGRRTGTIRKIPASDMLTIEDPCRMIQPLPAEAPATMLRWLYRRGSQESHFLPAASPRSNVAVGDAG